MIKIEVKSANVTPRNVLAKTGRNAGQTIQLLEQEAYAHTVDAQGNARPYPERILLNIEQGEQPYPPGYYTLSPASLYINRFQKLEMGRSRLLPIKAQ